MCALHFKTFGTPGIAALNHKERVAKYPINAAQTGQVPMTDFTCTVSRLERSRWRGGRFACYAPHVMPQRNASNCGSRTCPFSKYRKTNSLQMGEKIEFP
jgi:hypothetical protein